MIQKTKDIMSDVVNRKKRKSFSDLFLALFIEIFNLISLNLKISTIYFY